MKRTGHAAALRRKLVDWVATGGTVASFARQNQERSERQYYRWTKLPDFEPAVRRRTAELTQTIVRGLTAVSRNAVAELDRLIENPDSMIRLGAVRTAMRSLIDIGRYADLEARVAELEKNADANKS